MLRARKGLPVTERIDDRLPRRIPGLDVGVNGAWFRLRDDHWREDLAEALALALVSEPADRLVFVVDDEQAELRLKVAFEAQCVEGTIEVRDGR